MLSAVLPTSKNKIAYLGPATLRHSRYLRALHFTYNEEEDENNYFEMEEFCDIVLEALEVFINHILYARDLYPAQIFKKRRIYNSPVFVSIYPPLNTYLFNVLKLVRELLKADEFQCAEMLFYKDEHTVYERYKFKASVLKEIKNDDQMLLDFEEQLRAALSLLTQRIKVLEKLPSDAKFKLLVHTTQSAFTKLTHNPHYQEFPWLRSDLTLGKVNQEISLLPLAQINCIALNINAEIL